MKKRAIKFAGFQVALLITLLIVQVAIQFSQSYKWVGFEKREGSWAGIAAEAQANNSNCQIELEKVKAEKQFCIESNNPDLK